MRFKFKCPVCHKETIPAWKKLISAPIIKIKCNNCGSRVYAGGFIGVVVEITGYLFAVYLGVQLFLFQDFQHLSYFIGIWLLFDIIKLTFVPLLPANKEECTST